MAPVKVEENPNFSREYSPKYTSVADHKINMGIKSHKRDGSEEIDSNRFKNPAYIFVKNNDKSIIILSVAFFNFCLNFFQRPAVFMGGKLFE